MYLIIGGDKKTYGPVTADEVHRWIREGRADEQTQVQREGSGNWEKLGSLADFFPSRLASPPKITGIQLSVNLNHEGNLQAGECLRRGWQTYRQDPWRITGMILLVLVAQFLLNSIPLAGALCAFLLNGPILGGIYNFCHRAIHGQTRGLQDVTETIKTRFLPCFLATTVSSLLAFAPLLLALIPAVALFGASGVVLEEIAQHPKLIFGMGLPLLAGVLGMMYFLICWSLAVPIAACSQTDFWEALKLSWHGVRRNFWPYFWLLILLGGINLIGILCLGLGLFITIPITFLATMSAYDQIFRATDSR